MLTWCRCCRLQIKCRHFQAADMRKFQALWAMKQQEAQQLAQQLLQVRVACSRRLQACADTHSAPSHACAQTCLCR